MMAKDSVKKRVDSDSGTGMSFTEFTYQLVQGFDFLYLYREYACKLQMGGSDQWGNIVTGTELIRRIDSGESFALTCPLITKSDGGKFGKTEEGNVWLDPERTSPYKFYQFWLNVSDEDAEKYIKIFTMLPKDEISHLIKDHNELPHLRILQKKLAEEVTTMVHSKEDYNMAVEASDILFGNATEETLGRIPEKMFLSVFEGVPQFSIDKDRSNIELMALLTEDTKVFQSKGEFRRLVQGGGLSINKKKVTNPDLVLDADFYIKGKYLLVQKGKRNYFLVSIKSN
jgi:tyrosyl-tRNA synthetase